MFLLIKQIQQTRLHHYGLRVQQSYSYSTEPTLNFLDFFPSTFASKSNQRHSNSIRLKSKTKFETTQSSSSVFSTNSSIENNKNNDLENIKKRGLKLFIYYYYKQAKLSLPSSLTHKQVKSKVVLTRKKKQSKADPSTHHSILIPSHYINQKLIPESIAELTSFKSLKNTSPNILLLLSQTLARNVDSNFVKDFLRASRGKNTALTDQVSEELLLDIAEDDIQRLKHALDESNHCTNNNKMKQEDHSDHISAKLLSQYTKQHTILAPPKEYILPTKLLLPIHSQYKTILLNIHQSQVTIISAETGAGKTTQIPQFILDSFQNDLFTIGGYQTPNIICTQPRKIAATSVAERVAEERNQELGIDSQIGYSVRFREVKPMNTDFGSAVFCTTGVLLRKLQKDPFLSNITHVILDEVHERDLNTDLLLSILKKVLDKRPELRVILMSATADTTMFQKYLSNYGHQNALPPVINVQGKCFPVKEHYLEDLSRMLKNSNLLSRQIQPFFSQNFQPRSLEEQNMYLKVIKTTIDYICTTKESGAILIFLSGWNEISIVKDLLMKDELSVGYKNNNRFKICALHSSVPMNDQKVAFTVHGSDVRKIILATNIAETSITIKDVVYVVDSGMMKLMRFDSSRELSSIKDELVSQSNTRQRIGRAGRVQKGEYFSMLPLKVKLALPLSITTEIQRSDLQSTVLQLKAMHFDAKEIIKAAPEAPDSSKIIDSITRLENIGALDSNGHLTSKGLLMSKLPMTPWISNLIIQGIIYKCLDPLLTIAAILSCDRTPFQYHPTQVIEARQYIRKNYALGSNSDQLTALNAIKYVTQRPDFDQLKASDFDQMFLKRATVQNIIKAKAQYTQILEDAGILVPSYDFDRFSSNVDYIKAIFGKSLLRNVAELAAKNVYKGKYFQMRLTGSSVNSYGAQGQEEEEDTQIEGQDKIFDEAHVNEDDSLWDFSRTSQSIVDHSSVTFAKLLVYQELHQVDRLMFMRNTSEITPLSVVLFSNSARISSGNRTEISTESGLRIGVSSFSVGKLLREFNQALIDYEDYVLTKLSDRHVNVVEGDALHDVLHQLVTNDRSAA